MRGTTNLLKMISLAGLIAIPWMIPSFYADLVARVMLFGIFAMSLALLVGFTGLVSLGHAAYFGTAAYVIILLAPKTEAANLWFVLPAAIIIAAMAALVVGYFVVRTRGVYFIMATLAFGQMAFYVFHDTKLGGGSDGVYLNVRPEASIGGFKIIDLDQPMHMYYLIVSCFLFSYLMLQQLLRSSFGGALIGIKSNEHRMRSLGYSTFGYKLAAFTIAGGMAGLAGALYTILFGYLTPELLSWHQSANALLIVIIGGAGNLAAVLAGTALFLGLQELLSSYSRHWQLVMGIFVILYVLFLPGGLAALPERLRSLFARGGDQE